MVDKELISRKISKLLAYITGLEQAEDINWEKYKSDARSRAFVERYIHLAIEEVFDISNHIIAFHSWREPSGYRDLFVVLNEKGIVPDEQLENFQNMASFRNMLVHHYEKIEDELVFGFFKKRLNDFLIFIELIRKWNNNKNG